MARMSLPQMEDAFIWTKTCPCPGVGIGCSRKATVLLPGSTTPRIALPAVPRVGVVCVIISLFPINLFPSSIGHFGVKEA